MSSEPIEILWQALAEDELIRVYVPEADQMTREQALSLAQERDLEAARNLYESALNLEAAAAVAAL